MKGKKGFVGLDSLLTVEQLPHEFLTDSILNRRRVSRLVCFSFLTHAETLEYFVKAFPTKDELRVSSLEEDVEKAKGLRENDVCAKLVRISSTDRLTCHFLGNQTSFVFCPRSYSRGVFTWVERPLFSIFFFQDTGARQISRPTPSSFLPSAPSLVSILTDQELVFDEGRGVRGLWVSSFFWFLFTFACRSIP
jgi:hypothetical protein